MGSELIEGIKLLATYLTRRTLCLSRPLVVMIEPTNICNLDCIMCAHGRMTRDKGYISFELFKKIINCNYGYIRHLGLYLMGEPLLHPELSEMIRYAKKFNIWTRIYTNATLLDEEKSRELILSGLDVITFSFEGVNKKSYENIRRRASYEDVLKNIQSFISIKRSLKRKYPYIYVEFIDINFGQEEKKRFILKMKRMGVDKASSIPLHGWMDMKREESEIVGNQKRRQNYYPCFMPWVAITILWDGKVVGCCDDFNGLYVVADANETPFLATIWNNRSMRLLRSKLAKKEYFDLPHCKYCERARSFPLKHHIMKRWLWVLQEYLERLSQ